MSAAIRLTVATLIGSAAALALVRPAAAQQANAANSADALETIIVTAQKRSEDVQTVPMSITTISQDELARQGATQLADFAGYVPGLQFFSLGTPGQAELSLRGIPPLGSSSTVATYLDETPLGSSGAYSNAAGNVLDMLPYDVQSFEVLRGPQGTLYGASSLGGLIKYVTRTPDLNHYSVHLGTDVFALDGADKAGLGGRISVNVPLLADKLAMSASFSRENTPGYIDNALTGARHQNDYSQQAARVALLWKPNEDLSVTVSGLQQKIIASNNSTVALTPGLVPVFGDFKYDNHMPERLDQTFNYFSATVDYNLGWADLVSATSYSNTRTDQIQDATLQYGVLFPLFGFPAGESAFYSDVQLRKTTEELRLTSKPGEHVEWLAGVFYTHENSQNNQLATAQL